MIDLFLQTADSVRAHWVRFLLTSLGVAWGALLLTFLSAQMGGMRTHFMRELEETGPKLIFMGGGQILESHTGERGSRAVELDPNDVNRLESLSSVDHATPAFEMRNETVRRGRRTKLLTIAGYDADAPEIRNLRAAEGRFFSMREVEQSARVAFLGSEARKRLFGGEPALGGTLSIGSVSFRVIGVAVEKGEQLIHVGDRDDLQIYIPYTTSIRWLQRNDTIEEMLVAPQHRERGAEAIAGARNVTGLHHGFDASQPTAMWSSDMWDVIKLIFGMFYAIQSFFIIAGTVTLLSGAVGVMNIMLVVVGERTAEIGLRKAVGARGRDIFVQFLLEALAITTVASLAGVLGGLGLLRLVAPAFEKGGIVIPASPDLLTVVAVVGALAVVSVIAGVAPALRASRIPPAEALRAY